MKKVELKYLDRKECPVMRSVAEIGDKWILLILRENFFGFKRFDDYQKNLKVSRSVLSSKLSKMVELNLLEKTSYQNENDRTRYEYRLTKKGRDLFKVVISLLEWGNEHVVKEGEVTVKIVEKESSEDVKINLVTEKGERVRWRDVQIEATEGKAK